MPAQTRKKIVVIGGGIIGAITAWQLQSQGADVVLVDAGGARATAASFGWINASFYEDAHHHHLRVEGMAAYQRLARSITAPVSWCGSLCWDADADALEARADALRRFGYPVEVLGSAELAGLEPAVGVAPERVLRFPSEAVVEQDALVEVLLAQAVANGARIISGVTAEGVLMRKGRVAGVRLAQGEIVADEVLVAAGVGTPGLLSDVGFDLPMLHRPALVLRTRPVQRCVTHVLATDVGDIRQLPDGSFMMPAAVSHQSDRGDTIRDAPDVEADAALARLQGVVPELDLDWSQITLAERPVPGDGLPAVGAVHEGLYVATLHSGITLAAIMGELIATELLSGVSDRTDRWLSCYRPQRFQT